MTRPETRTIRQLSDDDLPSLMRFLLAHRESSLILLSNARRASLIDQGKPFQGIYLASLRNDEITGVAAHYWNGMIALQAPDDAAELARSARACSDRSLNGILGPSDQVCAAAAAIGNGLTPVFDSTEILYSLDLLRLIMPTASACTGYVRRATLVDLDTLAHWSADYNVELLGATPSRSMLETCRKSVRRLIEDGHQWVLTGKGPGSDLGSGLNSEPSTAANADPDTNVEPGQSSGKRDLLAACTFNAGIDDCIQIGGVWTPVSLRRRGHARAVVAGALRTARNEGIAQAVLFTGTENCPAQRAYHSLGFRPIGTYHILLYRHPA